MDPADVLGVLAHPGGVLVDRPELTVGVLQATSSTVGFEIELVARRPLDPRTAEQRQADIRAGVATRRLLPAYDEGLDLRFGWLDAAGGARWSYPSRSNSDSGAPVRGEGGPSLRAQHLLPPLFDAASFILAWPEIGFPETVVRLALPDRATVDRNTVSIWDAPPPAVVPVDAGIAYLNDAVPAAPVEPETGRAAASPRLLHRGEHAAVVLTRLTAVGPFLSMEVRSVARGDVGARVAESAFASPESTVPELWPGASIAVLDGAGARRLRPDEAAATGRADAFEDTSEYAFDRPDGDRLDLVVGWPAAALPDVRVSVPIG